MIGTDYMKSFLLFVIFSITYSCKKKDQTVNCSLSEASLTGNYTITSVKFKASGSSTEEDYFDVLYTPCQKDNILTINRNNTFTNTDAGLTCSPNSTHTGNWSLNDNIISFGGAPSVIDKFNCTGFTLVVNDFVTGDKITTTWTRQ